MMNDGLTGLAHCRHLKTVRTHLSGLVNSIIVPATQPCDATGGLTPDVWQALCTDGVVRYVSFVYLV